MNTPPTLALVTTLKGPKKLTQTFINYHLNIGLDRLYLFFDDPEDQSIGANLNNPKIRAVKCTSDHWKKVGCNEGSDIEIRQTLNADLALMWAREEGIDWITHIDVDELIYTEKQSIKTLLSQLDKSVSYISMPPLEATPSKLETICPFTEIQTFKILQEKNTINNFDKTASVDLESILFCNEYFRGHTGGKSFTRISNEIKSLKIHKPESVKYNKLTEKTLKTAMILHFDCYDYRSWLEKWKKRYDGSANFTGRSNRNKQFEEFRRCFEKYNYNDLLILYKKLHILSPDNQEALINQGYARKIRINTKLFNQPRDKTGHQ